MQQKNTILEKEREILERFFGAAFVDLPSLPDWITDELLSFWHENLFDVHYLPSFSLDKTIHVPLWKDRPNPLFYKKMREEACLLPGKWILVDERDKPAKKVPWIQHNDVRLLEALGLCPKNYLKKWSRQLHRQEYLLPALHQKGFGSRFCLTISEIDELKPIILDFLKIDPQKTIRLPSFIEYNYLGNAIYTQWQTTETWEWLEDTLDDGQHLASGCKSVGSLGWDPPEFWSTILTFRPVVELS